MDKIEGSPTALLGVYPTCDAADEVAASLDRIGVPLNQMRVDRADDEQTSLIAEMQQEVSESFVSPQVGVVYPKETIKAGVTFGPPMVAIGAILGATIGLVLDLEGWDAWLRSLVGAIVGGTSAATIAALVIPAMAVKNPVDPSPIATGVTLRVGVYTEEVEQIMVEGRPIRLDRLTGADLPVGTVVTEEDQSAGGIVEEVAETFARERHADPEDRTR